MAETFDGTFVCTGSMVNNVREDCRNFFLTANHCVKSKGRFCASGNGFRRPTSGRCHSKWPEAQVPHVRGILGLT